ncbi:unnamed protein product [Aspergillus oryzae RIB40]|uniref:DNA, SC010 n=2 Tax=Aspergillus oryzae TaxID=5062 RepID=Q2TWB9_ASPOR|nr:unnamed protein product [Aspergillus oryzae RIB40]EIT75827.1 hypothetical protein Ao3042_08241 [Aspergillus oryzae 3.042]KDE84180.1 hypothetical protein AO1008_10904 [Aspergillus oryzae 100-8]BAE66454.1 unnamed protein product [Aspergillus oryzae RIB40]|eukprot:EIT75827.1 hypothetical protein Ao3042_08241 [Aspergillus oryzae 3.042]
MSASVADTHDKGPRILAVVWTLSTLTTIFVAARVYIRQWLIRNAGIDDYIIVVSLCLTLTSVGMTTANVHMGYGKHAWFLDQSTVETISLVNTISFVIGIFCFTIPKVAVTVLLTRILNPSRLQRIWLWTMIGVTASVSFVCIFLLVFQCDPPQAAWQRRLVTEGKANCNDVQILIKYAIFNAALSASADLYLAIYPSTVLMKLRMPLQKRLALCAALGMGSIIESNVLILASCIPTLQPILELTLRGHVHTRSPRGKDANYPRDSVFQRTGHRTNRRSDRSITHVESQESILGAEERKNSHPLGAIVRTDDVSVEFNTRSGHSMPERHMTWQIA